MHTELGNLHSLVLCHNLLTEVAHLHRLFSLRTLDLSANLLSGEEALTLLATLPCLESLWLMGNPVAHGSSYWARCATAFGEAQRAPDGASSGQAVSVDGVRVTHAALRLAV